MELKTDKELGAMTRGQLLAHCRELYARYVHELDPTELADEEEEPDEDADLDDDGAGDDGADDDGGL